VGLGPRRHKIETGRGAALRNGSAPRPPTHRVNRPSDHVKTSTRHGWAPGNGVARVGLILGAQCEPPTGRDKRNTKRTEGSPHGRESPHRDRAGGSAKQLVRRAFV
jgi:hypothetical protein